MDDQAYVLEPRLLPFAKRPPLMLLKRLLGFFLGHDRLFRKRRSLGCLWRARRWACAGLRLETHQQRGARDDGPPRFEVFVRGEPEIGPSPFVFARLKALVDPGTHPIDMAQSLVDVA